MQRFVLEQNIQRFEHILAEDGGHQRHLIVELLAQFRRDLAVLKATDYGAWDHPAPQSRPTTTPANTRQVFRRELSASSACLLLVDPAPGLRLVDASQAYVEATGVPYERMIGRGLFEVFPDNPDDKLADGVSNLYASLCTVMQTRRPHAMALQRYDVADAEGTFVRAFWQPVNAPIFDEDGRISHLLHTVEKVERPG